MKKLFTILLSCMLLGTMCFGLTACAQEDTIYVNTNAYFAPFEYYEGDQIVGVDVDIMNMVGKKLGKKEVKKSVLCPYCGAPNPAENKFCVSCGNPTVKRCVNCGAELAPGEQFCGKCGVRVRDNTDPKD